MAKIFLIIILVASLVLRFWNYEGRTTYGWDQARDVSVLDKSLSNHELPLLGPIVRGDVGGLYLGPLYHYLLLPIYSLTGHNPLSLVWTSILLDVGVAMGLTLAFGLPAGIIWTFSSMIINSSLTPWNVSLIHPWVLGIILLAHRLNRRSNIILFLMLLSASSSIHLTLLPVALVVLIFAAPSIIRVTRRAIDYLLYFLALLLPQIPLILSDLSSGGANARALKDFLLVKSHENAVSLAIFMQSLISKIGYTTSRLFVGEPYLIFGCLVFVTLLFYGIKNWRKRHDIPILFLIIIVVISSLIIYRDPNFAEYYLNAMLVPLVVLASFAISAWPRPLLYLTLLIIVGLNLRSLDFRTSAFSMGAKRDLLTAIAPHLQEGVELRLLLPDHQQFGFAYYLKTSNIPNEPSQRLKLYIAPSSLEHVPAPSDAQSIIYQDQLSAFRLVVFSN